MAVGVCRLTAVRGRFVKCHIIPAALTRPERLGNAFLQVGINYRPITRWTSWYDKQLVIQKGENILRDYDTKAINELRTHRLIWSSWGNSRSLPTLDHQNIADTPFGLREIEGVDQRALRLFFLSVLWRAAATTLHEFYHVELAPNDLELLRQMVVSGNIEPVGLYGMHLVQLSTKGAIHNHTPILLDMPIRSPDGSIEIIEPIFRFYFDGLTVHIRRQPTDKKIMEQLRALTLGNSDNLIVSTVTYEASAQQKRLLHVLTETAGARRQNPG
jgi:hypothetical protein